MALQVLERADRSFRAKEVAMMKTISSGRLANSAMMPACLETLNRGYGASYNCSRISAEKWCQSAMRHEGISLAPQCLAEVKTSGHLRRSIFNSDKAMGEGDLFRKSNCLHPLNTTSLIRRVLTRLNLQKQNHQPGVLSVLITKPLYLTGGV